MRRKTPAKKEKIDQHDFLVAWSMGMSDDEIAKKLGVSIATVREVKEDLTRQGKG